MELIISKKSHFGNVYANDKPHPSAYLKNVPLIDQRTLARIEDFDKGLGRSEGPWLSRGTNHGCNHIGIYRQVGEELRWHINVKVQTDLGTILDFLLMNNPHRPIIFQEYHVWEDSRRIMEIIIQDEDY